MKIKKYYDPEIESMDWEELEALQLYRLKLQMRKCYRNSEFYREKFKQAGIKPGDIKQKESLTKGRKNKSKKTLSLSSLPSLPHLTSYK